MVRYTIRPFGCLILIFKLGKDFLYFLSIPYFIDEFIIINNKFFVESDKDITLSSSKKLEISSPLIFLNTISPKIGLIFASITD